MGINKKVSKINKILLLSRIDVSDIKFIIDNIKEKINSQKELLKRIIVKINKCRLKFNN